MKNGYICFGPNGKRCEVRADTTLNAQKKAAEIFKIKPGKEWRVSVTLAEREDGSPVIHSTASLG